MFTSSSQAIIYGRHLDVAQRMLDFDFLSDRLPSVAGIIDPNSKKTSITKLFFGQSEILVPVYKNIASIKENSSIDTFINMASFRSASEATWEAMKSGIFHHIVIIAEGIPEREIREIIAYNEANDNLRIIGPATAGAIASGALRMGNSGGSLDNIVASGLYRKGSVGFVSRSGGMSNEMFRVIGNRTNGIHTGIALGGDRFVCSTFRDIVMEYESNPEIQMIVLLGEVGSRDELEVVELLKMGKIKKPVVAYVSGSFAEKLTTEVQFGHAGAKANADEEKASFKNQALREAGAHVPDSYKDFGDLIESVANQVGIGFSRQEKDENIEQKMQIISSRKPTKFTSTISDERGEDVEYNHIPLTNYISDGSIARVIGALWLKKELPEYALSYINTILILLADHGPAVSGATNTIVTARAGKDILSSLVSGLLTIGPRFGGAIDGAARTWYEAVSVSETPEQLMNRMKKIGDPIQGIGHKVKSKFNPDGRCVILKDLAKKIPSSKYLNYALSVEALTLEKKANLILNVDGHIAASLLDIFESVGMDREEIRMYIDAGIFNAFFILARSIGFIGHALDQKRLGEPLYRTAWEDIHYGE
ncbi:ATP citrate synthase [Candidatus Gracilibacteria bacterium]|nr:ATP citrate synthase [Candidatus Gracilibacteria bacterium]